MRKMILVFATILALALSASPGLASQTDDWTFSGIERVELDGVSGDLRIEATSGRELQLSLLTEFHRGRFEPEVERRGSTLSIGEEWGRGRSSGRVIWTLRVPAAMSMTVEVDTASGDLEAENVALVYDFHSASGDVQIRGGTVRENSSFETASGDLELTDATVEDSVDMSTASGDVELVSVEAEGDFDFSTASGDVSVVRSRGILRGSTASGDVIVRESILDGPAEFSTASGSVRVRLSEPPSHDLELSTASGDVEYEAPFGSDFTLEMTAREDRGDIDAPFEFTDEDRFERWGEWYQRKTVRHGSGSPEIRLSTASGSIDAREAR